jgi:hypothetical protein
MEIIEALDYLDANNVDNCSADYDIDDTLHRLKLDCLRDKRKIVGKKSNSQLKKIYFKEKLKCLRNDSV